MGGKTPGGGGVVYEGKEGRHESGSLESISGIGGNVREAEPPFQQGNRQTRWGRKFDRGRLGAEGRHQRDGEGILDQSGASRGEERRCEGAGGGGCSDHPGGTQTGNGRKREEVSSDRALLWLLRTKLHLARRG